MNNRLKILQTNLLNEVSEKLSDLHFILNASKRELRAKRSFGSIAIILAFINHGGLDFDLTGSVGLRIDAVEDLVNEFNTMATKAERSSTFTIGAELGNLHSGHQQRWTIKNEEDVSVVASAFAKMVKDVGIPYFDKYCEMNNALEALSGNEPFNWLHSPIHGARCQRAVALAYVLKDNQKVKFLIQQNAAFLQSRKDFGLRPFEKLVEKIQNSGIERSYLPS